MKRTTITLAALLAALVPAAVGLWGNASFSQAVPVRVPASAQVVTPTAPSTTVDDHGGETPRDQRTEPGDDRSATSTPSVARTTEAADDRGGATPRDQRTEPGDDHGGSTGSSTSASGSSGSGSSGSGSSDSGSSGSGSGSSGSSGSGHSGSDDGATHHSSTDDSGSGGHGSDD
jgi:hypothetical protein